MNKLQIRQRNHNTYQQTFYFTDPPIKSKQQSTLHWHNIIQHNIKSSETQELKNHRKSLNKSKNQHKNDSKKVLINKDISQSRKLQDLKGQLEIMGTQMFLKGQYQNNKCPEKLIATDCSFTHPCYDSPSKQNEFARYNKQKIGQNLKLQYDIKHQLGANEKGRIFIFKSK